MTSRWPSSCATLAMISLVTTFVGVAGCQPYFVDPFRDALAHVAPATTASVEAARRTPMESHINRRMHAPKDVAERRGIVLHGPLYFEGPFEEPDKSDTTFAWSSDDYLAMSYGSVRFLANAVLWPVSASLHPPWRLMESDGCADHSVFWCERHDADAAELVGNAKLR